MTRFAPRTLAAAVLLSAACSPHPPAPANVIQQARGLIRSPYYARESLLWAQALGLATLTADCNGKLARQLERRPLGDHLCEFRLPINPAGAVLASRPLLAELQPLLSMLDVHGLEMYNLWSNRPESVGFERPSPDEIRLRADLGPDDLILVRTPFGPGWSSEPPADIRPGPIGYTVVDPGVTGPVELHLTRDAASAPAVGPPPLPENEIPLLSAEGVVAAPDYSPPPFLPGSYVMLFGERFRANDSVVRLGDRVLYPSFSNEVQINVQLPSDLAPGAYQLTIEAAGVRGRPTTITVAR